MYANANANARIVEDTTYKYKLLYLIRYKLFL